MKIKNFVLVAVLLAFQVSLMAQPTVQKPFASIKGALDKIEASKKEPQLSDFGGNEKKFLKAKDKHAEQIADPSFWFERGEAFKNVEMYAGDNLGLGVSSASVGILRGNPKTKTTEGSVEIWNYEGYFLAFEEAKLKKWGLTEPMDGAFANMVESYNNSVEKDAKGKMKSKVQKSLVLARNYYRNEGIMFYFDKQFDKALKAYEQALYIFEMPIMAGSDTLGYNIGEQYYYAAAFAEAATDPEKSVIFYSKLIEYNKANPTRAYEPVKAYRFLANTYKTLEKRDLQEKTLLDGLVANGDDKDLMIDMTQYYLDSQNSEKALEFLKRALEKDPNNYVYIFVKGTLYDSFKQLEYNKMDLIRQEVSKADSLRRENKMTKDEFTKLRDAKTLEANALWVPADQNMDLAITDYNASLAIEPDYFNAKYNIGAVYYNKAAQIIKMAELIPTTDVKKYDEQMNISKELFEKARPFLEEASVIEPNNVSTLQTLSTIYAKLGMYDKVKELKARITEIENSNSGQIK